VTVDDSRAAWLQQTRSHLRYADPVLARLIDDRADFDPSCQATLLSVRPSRPPINSTTSRAKRRSSLSPRNGGPTAAWRPAICFPPPSSPLRGYRRRACRSADSGVAEFPRSRLVR
jgi:hypothetical protein